VNTNVKIKTLSNSQVLAKQQYIFSRLKSGKKDISIIVDNHINTQFELSAEQKKERIQLQKNLHIYAKRLEKAIQENKEKSILTNQKKVDETKKALAKTDSRANKTSKKKFIEITLSLTNAENWKTRLDKKYFEKITQDFVTSTFSDLNISSIAAHYDQSSPHLHILIDVGENETWSNFCRTKYKVANTREAYSKINNSYHDYIKNYLNLDEMQKGIQYCSLKKLKSRTDPTWLFNNIQTRKDSKLSKNYYQKLDKIIKNLTQNHERQNANQERQNANNIKELAQIFYEKTDSYIKKEDDYQYVNIKEFRKIDIQKFLKDNSSEINFLEGNIREKSLLDIAKCFLEVGFPRRNIIKINYEKIKLYTKEALKHATNVNSFESIMQKYLKIYYFTLNPKKIDF